MNKRYLPFETSLKSAYEDLHKLFSVEGGAYYFATRKNKYYVLSDFTTLIIIAETALTMLVVPYFHMHIFLLIIIMHFGMDHE